MTLATFLNDNVPHFYYALLLYIRLQLNILPTTSYSSSTIELKQFNKSAMFSDQILKWLLQGLSDINSFTFLVKRKSWIYNLDNSVVHLSAQDWVINI